MPTKKTVKKKKPATKKTTGGIASYVKKIQNAPKVKAASFKIKKLETTLKQLKKVKAAAVKDARKKLSK